MSFSEINLNNLNFNPFNMIGDDWYLITAGTKDNYNTMTASWGFMGVMWGAPAFVCAIRPNRYTFQFAEQNDTFSVSFFGEKYKSALNFCGTKSGRDYDKAKETGLTPVSLDGTTTFEEADLVYICQKQYADFLEEKNVINGEIMKFYNPETNPLHKVYISKIIAAYKKV